MHHFRDRMIAVGFVFALVAVFVGGSAIARAQDATPVAADTAQTPHPAHIHEGTCDNLNPQPLYPLADVQLRTGMNLDIASPAASPVASPVATGAGVTLAVPAAVSVTTVDVSLDALLAAEHAINVHESVENIENYIACGVIGGIPDSDGNLFIGLEEVDDSGFTGIAWLQANDQQTIVTIFLAEGLAGGGAGPTDALASPGA